MNKKIELPMKIIIGLHAKGLSTRELAKIYSVDHMLIYRRLKDYDVNTTKYYRTIDKSVIKNLNKQYTRTEMARIMGITEPSLRYYMKKYKIKPNREIKGTWKILFMWEQTHNKTEIAKLSGVSLTTVYKVLKANDKLDKGAKL